MSPALVLARRHDNRSPQITPWALEETSRRHCQHVPLDAGDLETWEGMELSESTRALRATPGPPGSTAQALSALSPVRREGCGAMMLPLSTIEGQETEEVQTRPPEKGGETRVGRNLWQAGVGKCPGCGSPAPNICPWLL